MEPDPEVFLPAIHSEILAAAGSVSNDPLRAITLQRVAEAVAYLAVRYSTLPEALRAVQHQQRELIEESASILASWGVRLPSSVTTLKTDHSAGDEDCIQTYERMITLQSDYLKAMYVAAVNDAERRTTADRIAAAACEIERNIRQARETALKAVRERNASRASGTVDPDKETPTPEALNAELHAGLPEMPNLVARSVTRLKGVNTKEVYFVDMVGNPAWSGEAILRRNRPFDNVGNEVACEFEPLKYLHEHNIPVPRPLLSGDGSVALGRSYLLMERVSGGSAAAAAQGAGARDIVISMAQRLAEFHRLDPATAAARFPAYGSTPHERTLAMIERFYQLSQTGKSEPSATLEAAFGWLRAHIDMVDGLSSIVHGDYSLRNLLAEGNSISAILDWELCHIGHPAEDLGYCKAEVIQVMPWEEFLGVYRAHGGPAVTDETIRYFQIYGYAFRHGTIPPIVGSFADGRLTDYLLGSAGFIEYHEYLDILERLLLNECRGLVPH